MSFLPFTSLVVDKISLFFQLPQAWAFSFHRPFPSGFWLLPKSPSIMASFWISLKRAALMKTLEKQDCFQAFHVLAGQAKNGEIDLWEYTMTLYSVENHEYSRAILIQPVLQLTAKRYLKTIFLLPFFDVFQRALWPPVIKHPQRLQPLS